MMETLIVLIAAQPVVTIFFLVVLLFGGMFALLTAQGIADRWLDNRTKVAMADIHVKYLTGLAQADDDVRERLLAQPPPWLDPNDKDAIAAWRELTVMDRKLIEKKDEEES